MGKLGSLFGGNKKKPAPKQEPKVEQKKGWPW